MGEQPNGGFVFRSIMLRALVKRVKMKLRDLVGSLLYLIYFQGPQNMLDVAIFYD